MVVVVWQLDLQLSIQSVPITTKVASSNPVHGKVYSLQHYVIMFVNDLQVCGFLRFDLDRFQCIQVFFFISAESDLKCI
jgi:hypothetical protein